ncbi:MAG: hypothetical protein ACJ0KA_01790 [Verrucomicrobiales bacterium]
MARPVGEEEDNVPKAISRPEGGWFARIWDERNGGPKKMIKLGRSAPFTIWTSQDYLSINECSNISSLSESLREKELISLSSSKAFTVWAKATHKSERLIESIPDEAFDADSENVDHLLKYDFKPFTVWITEEALIKPRVSKIRLIADGYDDPSEAIEDVETGDSALKNSEHKEEVEKSHKGRSIFFPVACSLILLTCIIWMFFKASQLDNLNTKNDELEGEMEKVKNEISEKNQEIEKINQKALTLEKNLRDDQLKFQRSTANAKEVNRLEMKKANEVIQGKLEDIKTLTEQAQANQNNYENKEKVFLKQISDFKGQISSMQSTNLENMNALKKAQVVTKESNKKNTALNKEVSDLKSDLTDSKELLKKSRDEYEKQITQEKTELNKLKASLEKELTEKKKVQEDLETTKDRLDKAEAEVNELNKKIQKLEEAQSPSQ